MSQISQSEVGQFIDRIAGQLRTPAAVAGRLLEEVVELALESGLPPGKIFEHITDALHNQALKASENETIFPSQLQPSCTPVHMGDEAADVSLVFKDYCYVAGIDIDAEESAKWKKFKLKKFRVSPTGVVYSIKRHIK